MDIVPMFQSYLSAMMEVLVTLDKQLVPRRDLVQCWDSILLGQVAWLEVVDAIQLAVLAVVVVIVPHAEFCSLSTCQTKET
jgi:hypothetical protein